MALAKDRAAYSREWRRRKGMVKGREPPLPTEAELEARGKELAAMMNAPLRDLRWPTDLFGNNVSIEQLMADGDFKTPKIGRVTLTERCAKPGCGNFHNNRVSGPPIRTPHGDGWTIKWYCSADCKSGTTRIKAPLPKGTT